MGTRKKRIGKGDVFQIPLADGETGLVGQVLSEERMSMNSVAIALLDVREAMSSKSDLVLDQGMIIALLLVTPDLLESGSWPIIGRLVPVTRKIPYAELGGGPGTKVTGSANAAALANAWFGLTEWDAWHDPRYLDKMLIEGRRRPATAVFKP